MFRNTPSTRTPALSERASEVCVAAGAALPDVVEGAGTRAGLRVWRRMDVVVVSWGEGGLELGGRVGDVEGGRVGDVEGLVFCEVPVDAEDEEML